MGAVDGQPVVLLTETDALLGMDLSEALARAGYRVVGPIAAAEEALAQIEREAPSLAVVDTALKDRPCTDLLRELRLRGVPCLVHTDGEPGTPLSHEAGAVRWLRKPAWPQDVVVTLDELQRLETRP
ncbi:DNA-binding response OmpR family regulator [Methylobacterium sp. BE186]|uniref:hypothetical protein n=1 Tax=Methylobacterium sp. BE186 TaxID=2817715 RepID=UPI00286592CB|nr:hypothetical protein [Methylobacterium sp. BE186]MDR7037792.1 DNA-binding response OmpR family regulator [Methylobacterium sp. BE186]